MTLRELSQLFYLNREIEMDKQRLLELQERALPGAQRLSTDSNSGGGTSDIVGSCAAEIADLKSIIEEKYQRCLYERSRLEQYISGIEDSRLRQIFIHRFVEGLSWRQVADRVGGGNTGDGCRKAVIRYVRKK